ncbi:MAG TPA: DinB family protein [Gemmataceae bacterium]|nr:DinB family protein [Gemmataceae bacterium]
MFDRERLLYADMYGYARQLVADIPDEELAEQPVPGLNHPAWILGHLVIAADYALKRLGAPMTAPEGWAAMFFPGTVPDPNRATYPSKGELLNAYEAAHAALSAAVASADPARAAQPNTSSSEAMRARFPTLGDLLGYLLTTHEAGHLGQLSAWRRMMGKKGVMG